MRCEPEYGFSGLVGFNYQSAKDSLKEIGLSVKKHRKAVMAVGRIVYLDSDKFQEALNTSSGYRKSITEMSAEDINRLAGV